MMEAAPQRQHLSKRGQTNYDALGPIIDKMSNVVQNTYDPVTNPKGVINAGIAENSLNYEKLLEYYSKLDLQFTDLTYGDDIGCSARLKQLYADFLSKRFEPVHKVKKEHLFFNSGVSAVIDTIIYNICNPGDGVLIAKPYYNGFDIDLTVRSNAIPIGVDLSGLDPVSHLTLERFEKELQRQKEKGVAVKAVILTNPHNPLGRCYPRSTVREYIRFCHKHDIYLISDEIYALSVYNGTEPMTRMSSTTKEEEDHRGRFHSVLSFDDAERDGFEKLLMLHGMSKDFCANGFRVGVCVNPYDAALRKAMTANSFISIVSALSGAALAKILADADFLDDFLRTNRARLAAAQASMIAWCERHGIPYGECHAGHFIVLDLRAFLRSPPSPKEKGSKDEKRDEGDGWRAERALAERMSDAGVFVSPGEAYHFPEPGHFRFTFSMRADYRAVALARLAAVLGLESSGEEEAEATGPPRQSWFTGIKQMIWSS